MKGPRNILLTLLTLLLATITTLALPTAGNDTSLIERGGGCATRPCWSLEGNGDPHQQILHKQLSVWVDCGGANCATAPWQQQSYTLAADTHGHSFYSGDFDVSYSVDTGISDGCAGTPGQKICVWATIWFTDYTVNSGVRNSCAGQCNYLSQDIFHAPNTLHDGYVEYYCAYDDDCGDQGQEWWSFGGAGGPLTALEKRQTGCMGSAPCVLLEGNGNPHQQILHKQLSTWVDCGGTTCGVADTQQQSYTLYADSKGLPWTTGDFDVVQSVETGTFDGCFGSPGQTVCVWSTIWFTDYTVRAGTKNPCFEGCDTGDETTIIHAPNTINNGVEYYCAYDSACGDKGQEYWIAGPAMGPPSPAALDKRQSCMGAGSCTKLEGDGDPHQWILHKQLSGTQDCGDTYCVVSETDQIDYKISANTHGIDWIAGDLEVAQSVQTGKHNGCTGGGQNPGLRVCTKAVIWHTDYTVRGGMANSCDHNGCIEYDDTTIIRSPNKITRGVEYYCAYDDDCTEQGDEFWIAAQAGPPPKSQVSI